MRRERLQFREKLQQILRRLRENFGQHDFEGIGAYPAHPVVGAVPAGRPAHSSHHVRQNDGAEMRGRSNKARRQDAQAEDEGGS